MEEISTYGEFKAELLARDDRDITTVLAASQIPDQWIIDAMDEAMVVDDSYCVSRLLRLNRKLLETFEVEGTPYFIGAALMERKESFELMTKVRLNPNIYDSYGKHLCTYCNEEQMQVLLTHPDLDVNTLIYMPRPDNCLQLLTPTRLSLFLHLSRLQQPPSSSEQEKQRIRSYLEHPLACVTQAPYEGVDNPSIC